MTMKKTIVWFREDFRVSDNPALFTAVANGEVLPVYINDINTPTDFLPGAASKVWLHHALNDLNNSLDGCLHVFSGNPLDILTKLISTYKITDVHWNRCYDKYQIARDIQIKKSLCNLGANVTSFNGHLLWEPWEILKSDKTQYKVFTPYYRSGCLKAPSPRIPLGKPQNIIYINSKNSLQVDNLDLLPKIRWDIKALEGWDVSENGAHKHLDEFLANKIDQYKIGRDFPGTQLTSRLSPYLHFGQISVHTVWHKVKDLSLVSDEANRFMSELGWREFSYYLLFHFPELYKTNWQSKFNNFPWRLNHKDLKAWQSGNTGIPIVDAGMRELWQTGFMHNRVRMIVASFLTKNLLIDWRRGASWFLDTLFDADIANNSGGWQWVAGCGADAQPYFRIFNPVTQGEKFDPEGIYIKKYVPELKNLPLKYIYAPWLASNEILSKAGVVLGNNYPLPIVDLANSRNLALSLYKAL
ncbi:MAG: deoxyribodipyrimidine photolyase [Burkholderiales bacterium]|jgi:deoxyribodipyrimidine photo-lyase|nr:deoxyribodipyrimidine photolyase [Burkholderiales bacterium]